MAQQFPDIVAYFLLEPGRVDLKGYLIPDPNRNEAALTWERFKEYRKLLMEQSPGRIVIDSLDILGTLCETHHAKRLNVDSIFGINDYGKALDIMKTDWYNTMNGFISRGFRFLLLSHARKRPLVTRGVTREEAQTLYAQGLLPDQTQPTAAPWAVDWAKQVTSFMAYYGPWEHDRCLFLRGGQDLLVGTATEDHFTYDGHPYSVLRMGSSAKQAWDTLQAAWNNEVEGFDIG